MGMLEWDSVNNTLVHFFPNQTGYLSAAPADDKILVLFYDTPTISILEPRGASMSRGSGSAPGNHRQPRDVCLYEKRTPDLPLCQMCRTIHVYTRVRVHAVPTGQPISPWPLLPGYAY